MFVYNTKPEAQSMGVYYVANLHSAKMAVSSRKKCCSDVQHLNDNLSKLDKKRDFL